MNDLKFAVRQLRKNPGFTAVAVLIGDGPVAVISHGLWQRRFGADPGVVGRGVSVSGRPFTINGVAPRHFAGTQRGSVPDLCLFSATGPTGMRLADDCIKAVSDPTQGRPCWRSWESCGQTAFSNRRMLHNP